MNNTDELYTELQEIKTTPTIGIAFKTNNIENIKKILDKCGLTAREITIDKNDSNTFTYHSAKLHNVNVSGITKERIEKLLSETYYDYHLSTTEIVKLIISEKVHGK